MDGLFSPAAFTSSMSSSSPSTLVTIPALAQFDSAHSATPIGGTRASGSKNVITLFTEDGIARYQMNSNGSSPQCITGVMNWVHGTFTYNSDGSMTMYSFGNGFQQIPMFRGLQFLGKLQRHGAYQQWQIFVDPTNGPKLHMYQFDGSPLLPMFLISTTPNMLPTQPLCNVSSPSSTSSSNVSERSTNDAPPVDRLRKFITQLQRPHTALSATSHTGLPAGVAALPQASNLPPHPLPRAAPTIH
ncbi:chaperone for protein-folding within the ER, fungal-domain-containing protein [Lactarius pseudohatsudake]|nr:chaperone for protein-folding within the ER, fungal-domain-containing protein [Lactarius pseudohatsudake]